MKIIKYLLLLSLLFAATISVFIATKNGDFFIKKQQLISVSKLEVFNYLVNKNNWKDYNPWRNEKFKILNKTAFETDSIQYKILLNQKEYSLIFSVKDSLNSTILTWTTKGNKNFNQKLLNAINQGVDDNLADKFEESLKTIQQFLTSELNSFTVKNINFINRDTIFYIQKVTTSKTNEIQNQVKKIAPNLLQLLNETQTKAIGNPFVLLHSKDSISDKVVFSVALQTQTKVFTTPESDIVTGQTNPFQAVKATLIGNYIHKPKAVKAIFAFMNKNKLAQSPKHKEVDIFNVYLANQKLASKWETEILIPVRPKKIVFKTVQKIDTLKTNNNTIQSIQ